jgi:hypothetical protein
LRPMAIGEGLADLFRGHCRRRWMNPRRRLPNQLFLRGLLRGTMLEMFAGANGKHSLWTCGVPANSVKVVITRARAVLDPSASRPCAVLVAGFSRTCAVQRFFLRLVTQQPGIGASKRI